MKSAFAAMLRAGITRAIFSACCDFLDRRGFLAYGLLFALIWLIWLMGIVDGQVIIEAAGNCTGNGSHMLTVENCNLSGNITNWTVTN